MKSSREVNIKNILNLQSKMIKLHFNALLLLGLYIIVALGSQTFSNTNIKGVVTIVLLFLLNVILYKMKYNNKYIIYMLSKVLGLTLSAYMSVQLTGAMKVMFLFFGLILLIELIMTLPLDYKEYTIILLVYLLVSMSLIVGLGLKETWLPWDIFFALCMIMLFTFGYYVVFTEFRGDLLRKLTVQTKLFKEAAKTNEELRLSQNKFKLIHEDMAKQKYELEIANKQLNKMSAEIYTQNELLQYISSVLEIKELMDMVTDAIMGTIGVDTCSLILFDEIKEEYLFSIKSNHPGEHIKRLKEDVENGLLQKYFVSEQLHINNRVIQSDYEFIADRPVGSIAIIPLLRDDLTYGLLVAEHSNIDIFTESNVQFFTGIASQITIAINNANLYALMENMAINDGLTGIYNRKYLIDHIEELVERSKKKNKPLSIALFDIDKFKSVNDKYGHLFGDEAIKMVAFLTLKCAKKYNGLAIRYGGEEFVLVLPDLDMKKANEIVTELHNNIKKEVLMYEDKEVFINVSIGISSYPDIALVGEELLLRADNAMYYSKEHGRGRITLDKKDLEKVV